MQTEYEDMLRWVGIQPSWHVLDAACGGGSYLPMLLELVGAGGKVTAIDLAPENTLTVKSRAEKYHWPTLASVDVGSILALPYDDQSFDAIWCANTMQYLSEEQMLAAIREFRRVVRRGGLVAIKDYDPTGTQLLPLPYALFLRHFEALTRSESQNNQPGILNVMYLSQYMRAAGLTDMRQKPTLMVRSQPLREVERKFLSDLLTALATQSTKTNAPQNEKSIWQKAADLSAPDHVLNHPDFRYRELQTVFVGRVP